MTKKTAWTTTDWLDSDEAINYPDYLKTHFQEMAAYGQPKFIKKVQGVLFLEATSPEHQRGIGIHTLNPSDQELENALENALKDGFPAVWIHRQ